MPTDIARTVRIVAIGDSTTAGTPAFMSPLEAPPSGRGDASSQYSWWLMRAHPDWDVLNRGVNGERTDQIRSRFDRDVVSENPRVVVVIGGVNDVYQGLDAGHAMDNLRWMYERARRSGIGVVAGTIIPFNTASADQNARMRRINVWIREYALEVPGVGFVDTRAAVAANGSPDILSETADQLHPAPAGYRAMAEAIGPVIERFLR